MDDYNDSDGRNGRRLAVAITVIMFTLMALSAIAWALDKGGFYQILIPFIAVGELWLLYSTARLVMNELEFSRGG